MDNQVCDITYPAPLQDVSLQQVLQFVYQEDDQDVADYNNYNLFEQNAEQDCIIKWEQEEDEIRERYEEIQNEMNKITDITAYCGKCGDQAKCFLGVGYK